MNINERNINNWLDKQKHDIKKKYDETYLYKTPILKQTELWDTDLYKFCLRFPKGADLHAHGGALIPCHKLIEFILNTPNLYVDTAKNHLGYVSLKRKNLPKSYMPLKEAFDNNYINHDDLINNWTLLGCKDSKYIWNWFQELFEKHNDLNEVGLTSKEYFQFSYEYYAQHNIFLIEQRLFLKGKREDAKLKLEMVYDAYLDAKKSYPKLIVRVIPVGLKHPVFDLDVTRNIYDNTAFLCNLKKDSGDNFISGIDLVNEEDSSRSIVVFSNILNETIKKAPSLKFYLHAGESSSPDNNEISHAISLGTKRIGHGLNLWAHPELKDTIIKKNICLEVCPNSNQTLGYVQDMRNHPAKQYLKEGIPIVLCSDDAMYQENNTLSDDFFTAILAWDLNIEDIKKLCINSIIYSSLNEKNKKLLISTWETSWNNFISKEFN